MAWKDLITCNTVPHAEVFANPYFNLFQEHNSATVRNISMILGGFIEQVNAKFHMQE